MDLDFYKVDDRITDMITEIITVEKYSDLMDTFYGNYSFVNGYINGYRDGLKELRKSLAFLDGY
jgi:hypothetical protein